MFSPKLMILKGFPQKVRKVRNNRKIGVSLYACNFFICVYAHIFFYLLIRKKCNFIKHCALFVKIRGIIYINQSFTEVRNVSTLRTFLRTLRTFFAPFAHFSKTLHSLVFLVILSQTQFILVMKGYII